MLDTDIFHVGKSTLLVKIIIFDTTGKKNPRNSRSFNFITDIIKHFNYIQKDFFLSSEHIMY